MSYLTTSEAAERLGVSVSRVWALLGQERIRDARKLGRDWIIPDPPIVLPPKTRDAEFWELTAVAVASDMTRVDSREVARLRRMDPEIQDELLFGRWVGDYSLLDESADDETTAKWAAIVQGIAQMTYGFQFGFLPAHHADIPVGRALWGQGKRPLYREMQLSQLLLSDGRALRQRLLPVFQRMRNAKQRLDWREMARLIRGETRRDRREKLRQKITADYYDQQAFVLRIQRQRREEQE